MTPSPLQLEHNFFAKVSIEANKAFDARAVDESGLDPSLQVDIKLSQHNTEKQRYQLVLKLDRPVQAEVAKHIPSLISLEVVGFFKVDEAFQAQPDSENKLRVNGASLLYSAARENISMITSRGPYGVYLLPTLSFQS